MKATPFPLSRCAYEPKEFQRPYIIQAWSNLDGWQDTRFDAKTVSEAKDQLQKALTDKSLWMNGKPMKARIANKRTEYDY